MKRLFEIQVRGREHSWGFLFEGDPEHLETWRADGLHVSEVLYVIPVWVVQMRLVWLWCWAHDAWRWLRLW